MRDDGAPIDEAIRCSAYWMSGRIRLPRPIEFDGAGRVPFDEQPPRRLRIEIARHAGEQVVDGDGGGAEPKRGRDRHRFRTDENIGLKPLVGVRRRDSDRPQ